MPSLAALLIMTPIFGFSLTPPTVEPWMLDAGSVASETRALEDVADSLQPIAVAASATADEEADRRFAEDVRMRRELGTVHRALGIATWVSMTATALLGFIQYYNLYGIGAGQNDNPCVQGNAIFGQDQCSGNPWPHRISAITTSALYTATFALSFAMPDPNHASEGNGAYAEHLRIHEALRWVHLAGMLIQAGMGIALSSGAFGDRANDYSTLQTVAAIHQVVGWATWGTLTAAGAIMLF